MWGTGHTEYALQGSGAVQRPAESGHYRGQAIGFRSTQVPPSTTLVRTSQFQTAPRRQRVTRRRGLHGSRAPLGLSVSLSLSLSLTHTHTQTHTHTHTHTHTLAALARARGTTRTSQPQTHARTPRPAEFCISSSSKLLLRS